MTHAYLVKKAGAWLRKRCGVVFEENVCLCISGEIPDAIGFTAGGNISFLIECKTSRADFLADKKKTFRQHQFLGMGDFRFYMAPKGLIKKDELPIDWGLIEVTGRRAIVSHNPFGNGNIYSHWRRNEKHTMSEINMLYSGLLKKNK